MEDLSVRCGMLLHSCIACIAQASVNGCSNKLFMSLIMAIVVCFLCGDFTAFKRKRKVQAVEEKDEGQPNSGKRKKNPQDIMHRRTNAFNITLRSCVSRLTLMEEKQESGAMLNASLSPGICPAGRQPLLSFPAAPSNFFLFHSLYLSFYLECCKITTPHKLALMKERDVKCVFA